MAAAERMDAVLDPVIPRVGRWLAQRPGALSLAQGMVGWGPPPGVAAAVSEALAAAARDPAAAAAIDRYGAVEGDPELRQAVERQLRECWGIELEGSAVLITAGSNMAFNAVVQALLDPGDEVILPLPWYFNHAMAVQLAGGVPVGVEAGPQLDPERLVAAITPRTRAIVTISPGNPTGVVVAPEVLAAINRLCAHHGLLHISDEAYAAFVHGAVPHRSPGAASGSGAHTVTLQSLSKAYGMAGWRVGWAVVPAGLMEALAKVQDTVLICPPRLLQRAAVAALAAGEDWLTPRIATLGERRRQLLTLLAAADPAEDLRLWAEPDGAFYGLLDAPASVAGEALVKRLVLEHGVAALPGESFALVSAPGRALLRLSYGMLDATDLAEAVGRLREGLRAARSGPQ